MFDALPPLSPTPPTSLAGYGWTAELDELFAPLAEAGLVPGRLARVDRGRAEVLVADPDGGEVRTVRADTRPVGSAETIENPCTGDWVALDPAAAPLPEVRALLPRRTAIIRKSAAKASEGQVLAANIDTVLIAVSLAVEPDLGRVERFVALAWESGAQPLVALTKADLVDDAEFIREDVERVVPGVAVLVVSAGTGDGLDVLRACLGGTTALIGQSGAGKSTLTNALTGAQVMVVQQTRDADQKGRHTTTTRELFALPGGGVLIDTPACAASASTAVRVWPRPSPRSRNSARGAASTTARTAPSPAAPSGPRSPTAPCRSAGWTATSGSSARTRGSPPGPTPGWRRSGPGCGSSAPRAPGTGCGPDGGGGGASRQRGAPLTVPDSLFPIHHSRCDQRSGMIPRPRSQVYSPQRVITAPSRSSADISSSSDCAPSAAATTGTSVCCTVMWYSNSNSPVWSLPSMTSRPSSRSVAVTYSLGHASNRTECVVIRRLLLSSASSP